MYKMLILIILFLSSCTNYDEEKYELKSPCVADDTNNTEQSTPKPCIRRKINDNWMG